MRVHISTEIKLSFVTGQYESGVCYVNIHPNDGASPQVSQSCCRIWVTEFVSCTCFIWLQMQLFFFSCRAGNIRPVVRFEPRSFLLRSTCNLPPVLSVFPQYAFSYRREWNLLFENLTRFCTFGTGV